MNDYNSFVDVFQDDIMDLHGPLPTGHLSIEASAGTGKTFSLTVLSLRFILEGACRINELLLMTFTVAATAEIKARIIEALNLALRDLTEPEHCSAYHEYVLPRTIGARPSTPEPSSSAPQESTTRALTQEERAAEQALRTERVLQALADIDQLMVVTIDGFCAQMLQWVGRPLAGSPTSVSQEHVEFVTQTALLHDVQGNATFTKNQRNKRQVKHIVRSIAKAADMSDPEIITGTQNDDTPSKVETAMQMIVKNGTDWVQEIRSQQGLVSFSDIQSRLAQLVADNEDVKQSIQQRFKIVLVDEFQDTNHSQLDLIRELFFTTPDHQVIIVGDPKQSIYGFRGADVQTFATAKALINNHRTLETNYRSDTNVVRALNLLFKSIPFSEGVYGMEVDSNKPNRIRDGHHQPLAAVHIREIPKTEQGSLNKWDGIDHCLLDTVAHIKTLLSSGIEIKDDQDEYRPIRPNDITVILESNPQIQKLVQYLQASTIPVKTNSGDIYTSLVANYWVTLLRACEDVTRQGKVKLAMLTPFFGYKPESLASMDDDALGAITEQLAEWGQLLMRHGMQRLLREIERAYPFAQTMVASDLGYRGYTDTMHIAVQLDEWLQQTGKPALAKTLADYLEEKIRAKDTDSERSLWRDRTSQAVEVMTVHKSKGLERPIVLLPLAWQRGQTKPYLNNWQPPLEKILVPGLANEGVVRKTAVSVNFNPSSETKDGLKDEAARLAYVQATRAKHHVVIWHHTIDSSFNFTETFVGNAIASILEHQPAALQAAGNEAELHRIIKDFTKGTKQFVGVLESGIEAITRIYPGLFMYSKTPALVGQPTPYQLTDQPTVTHEWLQFNREIDTTWRRSSFSGLAASMDADVALAMASQSEDAEVSQQDAGASLPAASLKRLGKAVLLHDLPAGTQIGLAIHAVFEHLDFQSPQANVDINALVAEHAGPILADKTPAEYQRIVDGIHAVITTPLGPDMGNISLADIARSDRSDEMAFEFPVQETFRPGVASTVASTAVTPSTIGAILLEHLDPHDPFVPYARMLLEQDDVLPLHGYLLGFIDMVCAVDRPDGGKTYWVVDYKTNRIVPSANELITLDYFSPANMHHEMIHHHYPLQALIYQVALHRYLRQRIPNYVPADHLGGAAYLFLRGMVGPATPPGYGVVTWRMSDAALNALDLLFAGQQ